MNASVLIPLEVYSWKILQAGSKDFLDSIQISGQPDELVRVEAASEVILANFLNLALELAALETQL